MGKYHLYKININSALFLLGFTGNETSLHLTIRGQWDWVSGGRHDQLVARGGARAGARRRDTVGEKHWKRHIQRRDTNE